MRDVSRSGFRLERYDWLRPQDDIPHRSFGAESVDNQAVVLIISLSNLSVASVNGGSHGRQAVERTRSSGPDGACTPQGWLALSTFYGLVPTLKRPDLRACQWRSFAEQPKVTNAYARRPLQPFMGAARPAQERVVALGLGASDLHGRCRGGVQVPLAPVLLRLPRGAGRRFRIRNRPYEGMQPGLGSVDLEGRHFVICFGWGLARDGSDVGGLRSPLLDRGDCGQEAQGAGGS